MHSIFRKWSLIPLAVAVLLAVPVSGQVANTKKLSCVPPELRDKLVKRLELFIQYDQAHEYEKQFDLLSHSYLESNK
ncbi:MAG: hypothetical protein LC674_05335, partial [Actinobacteria bacterium]|nr:hypothetical protein [Actinomycetota bacterium]